MAGEIYFAKKELILVKSISVTEGRKYVQVVWCHERNDMERTMLSGIGIARKQNQEMNEATDLFVHLYVQKIKW